MEYVWETGRLSVPAGVENEKSRVKKMIIYFWLTPKAKFMVKVAFDSRLLFLSFTTASKQLLKVI